EQDHRSLRPCLLEETYEVFEAIDRDDSDALRQELGDVLLQVIFHAQLAEEAGRFDIGEVVQGLRDKLVARHPHVFGESSAETPEEVLHQWDSLKRQERSDDSAGAIIEAPRTMPALSRAQVVLRRAGRAGIDRGRAQAKGAAENALAQLGEEPRDRKVVEAAVGELLLAAVDLARAADVDAEQALRERVEELIGEVRRRGAGG
ncbi:MAG: MazG family protein, partial [Armatimonadetes bacterium]|nr:MazG family protein [Armatimonadota bacterium]